MATHAPITGAPTRAPSISAPPPAIARVLAAFDRDQLAGFVAVAIDLLDLEEDDPDLEEDDPPESAGDDLGDQSYPEWHTRGRHKLTARGAEMATGFAMEEDVEDDDSDTTVEDDPLGFDPEEDRCPAGDDMVASGGIIRPYYSHPTDVLWEIGDDLDAECNVPIFDEFEKTTVPIPANEMTSL